MNHIFEEHKSGLILRVRLSPNSSSCSVGGIMNWMDGQKVLKISVNAVPEKGKANKELISFLAKQLKLAKSDIEIVSGETDRLKRLLIYGDAEELCQKIENWLGESNV